MLKLFFILLFSLTLQAQSISDMWESSAEYKEYISTLEKGNIEASLQIKQNALKKITNKELKEYLHDLNEKSRQRYQQRIVQNLSPELIDTLKITHKQLSPLLLDNTPKGKHNFAQSLYDFINHYQKQNGKAQRYFDRLRKKAKFSHDSKTLTILKQMAIDSDKEAAKSPEQKRKELEEYIAQKNKEIAEGKKEIAEEKRKQAKWREITRKLNSL